jgi:hypothetical protein
LYYCGRRRRWFYAFVVTGAVAFLVTLPFVAERPTLFQAQVWISQPSGAFNQSNDLAGLFSSILRDALPAAVERVTGQTWTADQLDRLADATTLQGEKHDNSDHLRVTLAWDTAGIAEQLVRALAEELCARKNRETRTVAGMSNENATATRQCAEILRDDARADVADLKQLIAVHDNRTPAAEVVTTPAKPPVPEMAINPAWASLNRELQKIDSQRLKMLELYTAEHPLIASLTAQRDDLEARLAQIPKQVATKPELKK